MGLRAGGAALENNDIFNLTNILLLAVAIIIFFRLRSVLGRKTGNERPRLDSYAAPDAAPPRERESNVVTLPRTQVRTPEPNPGGQSVDDRLSSVPAGSGALQPLRDILRPVGSTVFRSAEHSPGSDIDPLVEAGVPGIGIIQDGRKYFDYHHTAADTLDKVDPQELRENAAAMAVMGYALASMPELLPRLGIEVGRLK